MRPTAKRLTFGSRCTRKTGALRNGKLLLIDVAIDWRGDSSRKLIDPEQGLNCSHISMIDVGIIHRKVAGKLLWASRHVRLRCGSWASGSIVDPWWSSSVVSWFTVSTAPGSTRIYCTLAEQKKRMAGTPPGWDTFEKGKTMRKYLFFATWFSRWGCEKK